MSYNQEDKTKIHSLTSKQRNSMTTDEIVDWEIKNNEIRWERELTLAERGVLELAVRKELKGAECKSCEDMKWLSNGITNIHDDKFGKAYPCPNCMNNNSEIVQEIKYEQANIKVTSPPSLDNFDPGIQDTARGRKVVKQAYDYIKNWVNGEVVMMLALVGGTGVGKTHLALGSAAKLVEKGKGVKYMNGEQFANELRPRSFKDDQGLSQRQFREELVNAEYLILDEVGIATDSTGWMSSQYQEIISHRFDIEKPTLITGNIEKYDDETPEKAIERVLGSRVVSRLKDETKSRLCSMWEAKDLRPILKTNN